MKVRLDEHLSYRVANAIKALLANRSGLTVDWVRDEHPPGTEDPNWIRKFADGGGHAFLSGDFQILQHWPNLIAYIESGLISFFPPPGFDRLKGYGQSALIIRWWPAIIEKAKVSQKEAIVGGYQWCGLQMLQNSRNSKTRASRQKNSKLLEESDLLRSSINSAIPASKFQFGHFDETARKLGCDEDKERRHIESNGGGNAVIGSFKDQSAVPDKVRAVMRANSQALAGLTMKVPC